MKGGLYNVANANLKFLHGKNIADNTVITPGTFYLDTENNELWYDDPAAEKEGHIRLFDAHFNDIYNQLADLQYEQIKIESLSFTNPPANLENGNLVEMGNTLTGTLYLNWTANKSPIFYRVYKTEPTEFQKPNTGIPEVKNPIEIENVEISQTQSLWLELGDERTISTDYPDLFNARKKITITFCYPVFYGAIEKGTEITSNVLQTQCSRSLQVDRFGDFTIEAGEKSANKISILAIPASYGIPTFSVGGFKTTYPVETVLYQNNEITESTLSEPTPYNVYYGTNVGLGTHVITVT